MPVGRRILIRTAMQMKKHWKFAAGAMALVGLLCLAISEFVSYQAAQRLERAEEQHAAASHHLEALREDWRAQLESAGTAAHAQASAIFGGGFEHAQANFERAMVAVKEAEAAYVRGKPALEQAQSALKAEQAASASTRRGATFASAIGLGLLLFAGAAFALGKRTTR